MASVTIETLQHGPVPLPDGTVWDPDPAMLLPRICMQGAMQAESADAWWNDIKPRVETLLRAYLCEPFPPGPASEQSPDTYAVTLPIPRALLSDAAVDVCGEMMERIEEATLSGVRHARSEPCDCFECRRRRRLDG